MDVECARARILTALQQPRPHVSHFSTEGSYSDLKGVLAWARNDHVIAGHHAKFPYHHTLDDMAVYLSRWSGKTAKRELKGAHWILDARPVAWVGHVTTNGNHRSLLAAAVGVPLVRVRLSGLNSWAGDQVAAYPPGSFRTSIAKHRTADSGVRLRVSRWSRPFRSIKTYAKLGLCQYDGWTVSELGDGALRLSEVDPLLPWIFSNSFRETERRYQSFCLRFGYATDGDWKLGSRGLRLASAANQS